MNSPDRLRQHPDDRLAPPVQMFALAAVAERLRAEPHPSVAGHRQLAIVRHGPVTVILFTFEVNGQMKQHRAEGAVTIHVLTGRLEVVVEDQRLELGMGELLALAPGLPHSLRALESSDMLLTVHLLPAVSPDVT
ncbi:MAG: cupin domain-containing protein [Gemmatimonadales bacterium]